MSDNIGCALIKTRLQTITILNELADEIDQISKHSKIALLTGTSVSILGTIVAVPLGILAIVFTGGVAAVPIAAGVAGGVGAAGGITSLGASLGGHIRIKAKHKKAVAAIEADRVLGQQFLDYSKVTRGALAFAGGIAFVVEKSARIAGNLIRAGDASLDALGVAARISKVAGAVSIAANVIVLPLDIYILVKTSKDIHYETRHEKAEEIRGWAKNLETSLPTLRNFVEQSMN